MGLYSINRRASVIGGTGFGGRQQAPLIARGQMFAGYDIPPQEVAELYKLYTQTGGPSWINHTNWFENKTCANWYGLTVAGGRLVKIELQSNNLAGATVFSLKPFADLNYCTMHGVTNATLAVRIPIADIPRKLVYIRISQTASGITGALSDVPATTQHISAYSSASAVSGGTVAIPSPGIITLSFENTAWTQAAKDSIIERIYADRAIFTAAAHILGISGAPALTGVYQAANPPTTPAEKAFSLVNDNLGEGFLKWTITL